MDGDINTLAPARTATDSVARDVIDRARPGIGQPKTVRWFVIVGLLLVAVLGFIYGFNRYREQAIAQFFANNRPPPAQIAAVTAGSEAVPHFATAIGSLAAVTVEPRPWTRGDVDFVHGGGRQFASKKDPDWQTIAEWVRGRKIASSSGP